MTTRMVLANIASFGLQVTVLVAAGAALARAFRIDEPRAMLAYWRTLLLACLLLPLCQPWNIVVPPALARRRSRRRRTARTRRLRRRSGGVPIRRRGRSAISC